MTHPGFQLLLILTLAASSAIASEPARTVHVEICEQGLDDKDEWPKITPQPVESFTLPAVALDELPPKYVDDGIRGARPSPSLLRMTATVTVPEGKHRLLLRSRSAARLTLDDQLIVETPFPPKNGGDGSQPDSEHLEALDLGVGYRFAPGGEYERIADWQSHGTATPLKLELFVGGREGAKGRRVELGETVVAISLAGTTDWHLLTADGSMIPYTDAAWKRYKSHVSRMLTERSTAIRKELRARHDSYWNQRHDAAINWLKTTREEPIPAPIASLESSNPIDRFLAAKFVAVRSEYSKDRTDDLAIVDYFRDIKPLLESRCTECHSGPGAKAGLRLDSRSALHKGGDSGPAVVSGDAANSELIQRISSTDDETVMPPKGTRLTKDETALLSRWIQQGAVWPELPLVRSEFTAPCDDLTFLRRVMLDTVGMPPTADEARTFAADPSPDKHALWIDRLLDDPRWADHWMPLWQDLLAENPNILNPTLNNTGPFRWWLYESLLDDLPVDRMVTQLIQQRGDAAAGGPAGFGLASQNDSPFAAKGTILSAAFLGVEMKCARCHDSPTGSAKQEQLFQFGAMLAAASLVVPKTSSVDADKLHAGGRQALIQVTLKPGSKVEGDWPFPQFADVELAHDLEQPRDRLAALLTVPQNERFAQVVANRVWARFMGRGIVEPLDNWEKGTPTHPELLRWLGREFVRGGYQIKPLARLILNSAAYQRAVDVNLRTVDPLYAAPEPRRLLAEQVVDSLIAATGKPLRVEPLCLDLNGRRDTANSIHLGTPHRAWMLASLSNERDRPSLSLPRLQALTDVLEALGWRGARQDPTSTRDTAPNALQPAILANGVLTGWLTRLSSDHPLTQLAIDARTPESLVEDLFLRLLTRPPTSEERQRYTVYLTAGFQSRVMEPGTVQPTTTAHVVPKFVTWTNHLLPESNTAKQQVALEAQRGDPPSPRLGPAWRQRCEDVIWALINSPEMLYRP
ncbi:MAG: DUF1553 domain-containing protein [Planctomycetes bacterium]|nr:DUF1553 domain-containing protein [Planctomycetota bacterium]